MGWVIAVVVIAGTLWGPIVSQVEQPQYTIVETQGDMEIRDYAPLIVAETEVAGDRENAISQGFRTIADYIFGNNVAAQKLPMTAPVTQKSSEKIAMTAPVTQQEAEGKWRVQFIMPSGYTLDTLPKPNNPAVTLHPVASRRFAVIRFSGLVRSQALKQRTDALKTFMAARQLKPAGLPTYAFYNPPWTLPFLRRNEVMIEIAGE